MNALGDHVMQIALVLLFSIPLAFAAGERNRFDPLQFSIGDFHGCPPKGRGNDPYLKSLKNRDRSPTTARLYTVNRLYEKTPTLPKKKIQRSKWTPRQQDLAARWERQAVMVEADRQNMQITTFGWLQLLRRRAPRRW